MKQRWEFMKENFNKKVRFKKIERKHALVRDSLITLLLKRNIEDETEVGIYERKFQ